MCKAQVAKSRVGLGSLDGRSCVGEVVVGVEAGGWVWASQVIEGLPTRWGPFTNPSASLSVCGRSPQPDKALRPEGTGFIFWLAFWLSSRVRGPHSFEKS